MIETHPHPDQAWSDARQQVTPEKLLGILNGLVIRSERPENLEVQQKLKELRDDIEALDDQIIELLKNVQGLSMPLGI